MNVLKLLGMSALFAVAAPTNAQMSDFPMAPVQFPSSFSGAIAIQPSVLNDTLHNSGSSSRDSVSSLTAAPDLPDASVLEYRVSQQRRKANLQSFAQKTKQMDPEGGTKMEQLFASTDIIDQLDQIIRPSGLSVSNVSDAYAVWWVAAWEAVNKKDVGSASSMYAAVKQQAASALLSTPQFASASDAQKQEMAESLLLQAIIVDGHSDLAQGNPAQQDAVAKAVNQGAKKMGLDLTTMDLTENGFVPRNGGRSDASDAVEGADPTAAPTEMAANDDAGADESDTGKLALYGVGGVALLAGMFALGKSFGGKG